MFVTSTALMQNHAKLYITDSLTFHNAVAHAIIDSENTSIHAQVAPLHSQVYIYNLQLVQKTKVMECSRLLVSLKEYPFCNPFSFFCIQHNTEHPQCINSTCQSKYLHKVTIATCITGNCSCKDCMLLRKHLI